MKLECRTKNFSVDVERADRFLKRFFGLMGRAELARGHALLLEPCNSVHTFFMRFPIDVIYLDRNNCVLDKETIRPGKIGKFVKGTKKILELNATEAENLEKGDILISLGGVF